MIYEHQELATDIFTRNGTWTMTRHADWHGCQESIKLGDGHSHSERARERQLRGVRTGGLEYQ